MTVRLSAKGFTLAELLIALAILGEIATFTIPKILLAQQNGTYKASAKEAIAAIASAHQLYSTSSVMSSSTKFANMTQYLNYVKVQTSGSVDWLYGMDDSPCSASSPCLKLHNGSVLQYWTNEGFGGTGTTNSVLLLIDPDGVYGGTTNGPGKGLPILLFYNGRVADATQTGASDGNTFGWSSIYLPPWFSW